MSAYVIVEFTVKDPDVYREKYGPNAGRTAKEYGGEVLASSNWEILHGDASLIMPRSGLCRPGPRFPCGSWGLWR